jgi:endoribonuclease LACTB2
MNIVVPKPAAAVILIRQDAAGDWSFFWARRAETALFLGGFHAFPGGRMEDADADVPVADADDPEHAARIACAVREVFEEAAVLLAASAAPMTHAERLFVQAELMEKRLEWNDFREQHGVRISAAGFIPAGRWVTPAGLPRRFDTSFFAFEVTDDQAPRMWEAEMTDGEWLTPRAALAAWGAGTVLLTPPTLHSVRSLARWVEEPAARNRDFARLSELFLDSPYANGESAETIDLRPGVVVFPIRTPTLPPATHTNCYIVGGPELVVIDPASPYPDEQARLDRWLEREQARTGAKLREIWLTHHHPDHAGGAAHLRERWNAPVAAHTATAQLLEGKVVIDRILEDGDTIDLPAHPSSLIPHPSSGWRLRAIFTPGHAPGHHCFFEESSGILISGDMVVGLGSVLINPPEGNMKLYLESLERLLELPTQLIAGGHGPALIRPADVIRQYIAHRLAREAQVLAAIRDGAQTPAAIVEIAYAATPKALHAMAERSVIAHLEKLSDEGKVTTTADGRLQLAGVA